MALEDIIRYESCAVAHENVKEQPGLALTAIMNYYQTKKEIMEDPIAGKALQREIEDAQDGLEKYGVLSSGGIINAIHTYTKKYSDALNKTAFSDVYKYLTDGVKVPDTAKEALSVYSCMTLEDISKKTKSENSKEKEDAQKALQAIQMLQGRKMKALTLKMIDKNISEGLEHMYPKMEKEGEKK